jgi:pantoate--beta-alanine ligase
MNVSETLAAWRTRRRAIDGCSIGLVPTMGALHRGHSSLVERCRAENQVAVVSIFVNPTQFNDPSDFERYPRHRDQDLAVLQSLGVDEVILPSVQELYPHGYRFRVEPHESDLVLEGSHRPGFLQGVLTVVLKLLNLVRADHAYFGEKDYQQLKIISEMAHELFLPTQIIRCPTVREVSGLAMSSRNALLSEEAHAKAAHMFRALTTASSCAEAGAILEAQGFRVEYLEERWARRLAAVNLEGVRLIDNVALEEIETQQFLS